MPMPMEIVVTDMGGAKTMYYVPIRMMWGAKAAEGSMPREVMEDWPWTNSEYELAIPIKKKDIKRIEIDPSHRITDLKIDDNSWEQE